MSSALPIVILGSGGHAKVLAETLHLLGRPMLGTVGPDASNAVQGLPYLGTDDELFSRSVTTVELVCGLGSVRRPSLRATVMQRFLESGFSFVSVIHPSATIAASARLEIGVQVMAGAIVSSGASLEQGVLVNTGAIVDHDCVVGEYSHIATGARLAGGVRIGACCHVGAGATIIQDLTVGPNSVVGAGAVVIRDVPDSESVVGVPARQMGRAK